MSHNQTDGSHALRMLAVRLLCCGSLGLSAIVAGGCDARKPGGSTATADRTAKHAAATAPTAEAPAKKVVLPGIVVDQRAGELQIEGEICIEQGILEYLAVADDGKTYESVFQLHCRPSQLHAAMLMAGYVAGPVPPELRGDFVPDAPTSAPARPEGAPSVTAPPKDYWERGAAKPTQVTIQVDVRQPDGTWKRRTMESFLIDRGNNREPASLVWAFTGSFFAKDKTTDREVFLADVERSLVALWYDPTALLNLLRDVGNPYRGESNGLEVNRAGLPPTGTPVRLILRRAAADTR